MRDDVAVGARIRHLDLHALAAQRSRIADLPAAFRVERRPVEHHHHLVARRRPRSRLPRRDQRRHRRPHVHLAVPRECRRNLHLREQRRFIVVGERRALPRTRLLLRQGPLEPLLVQLQPRRVAQLLNHLPRHPVRVVQGEGVLARDRRRALRQLVEQLPPRRQRLPEALLLLVQHPRHQRRLLRQLRVPLRHRLAHAARDIRQQRILDLQPVRHVQRPPDQPPQHVPAPLVRGQCPVRDQERHRPPVLRHHPHRPPHLVVRLLVPPPGPFAHVPEQRREQIRLVQVLHPLQHHRPALEPRPRIDVLRRQRLQPALFVAVVLHEDQIPNFQEPILVIRRPRIRRGRIRPHVVVQLRTRPARADRPRRPEIPLIMPVAEDP